MADMNIILYRTRPLTNRNDFCQIQGRLEGGFADMQATVLGVYGNGQFYGFGASLPDSNFSIIVRLQDVGIYSLRVIPIYRDGEPRYPYASEPIETVVHSNIP